MSKFLLFFLLITLNIFAQKIQIGNSENQLETYKYVLNNLEKIKLNSAEEIIYVKVNYNKNHFVKNVEYFSFNKENSITENKEEIKVNALLNDFIEKKFFFFSEDIFFSKKIGESSFSFLIPLNAKDLENSINDIQKKDDNLKNDRIGILANSKFSIKVENVYFTKLKYSNISFFGKLNFLNSQLIEIAPKLYLVFRIIKTNRFITNTSEDYFEYKIMYLNGTESELFVSNRSKIDNSTEIEITEIENNGGNDNLSDSTYCDNESEFEHKMNSIFEDIKFRLILEFQK